MARVALLSPSDLGGEDRRFAEVLDGSDSFINLYAAIAHSPVALRRFFELATCLWDGSVPARLREIAILTVSAASGARYPLGWHLLDAQEEGVTRQEIDTVLGGAFDTLPQHDAAVAHFARALTLDARVDDATFHAIAEFMDERQIVELTMVVGAYYLVACVANALKIDVDELPARALEEVGL